MKLKLVKRDGSLIWHGNGGEVNSKHMHERDIKVGHKVTLYNNDKSDDNAICVEITNINDQTCSGRILFKGRNTIEILKSYGDEIDFKKENIILVDL
jgi:hypothetical protein